MTLIEIFTDYIFNKKDLREYIKIRSSIHERGEFNDESLLIAQKNLESLKMIDRATYNLMYSTLNEYVKADRGDTIEYPINFIREILKLSLDDHSPQKVYEDYKNGLNHKHHDI